MKKIVIVAMMALAAAVFAKDQEILDIRPAPAKPGDAPSAVQWQKTHTNELSKLTTQWAENFFKGGQKAIDAELAWVMPAFGTEPLKAVEIAFLSQYVMTLPSCGGCKNAGKPWWKFWGSSEKDCAKVAGPRELWAKSLLKFAANAKEPEVTNWFLDQIRWCGLPCQAKCVRSLAANKDKAVKDFAEMVARELEGKAIGK